MLSSTRFKRSGNRGRDPSRNLFLANCGWNTSVHADAIMSLLEEHGLQNGKVSGVPMKSILIASFDSVEEAIRGRSVILQTAQERFGRKIPCEFSILEESHDIKSKDYIEKGWVDEGKKAITLENVDVEAFATPENPIPIPGLEIILEWISPEEEMEILNEIYHREWYQDGVIKNRRVQHYGFEFDYSTNSIGKELAPIPDFLKRYSGDCDQITINEYPPGVGIAPHVDTHSAFENGIFSLSLGSNSVMIFSRKNELDEKKKIQFAIPRRSLLIMKDEARFNWNHQIPARKYDKISGKVQKRGIRVSLTFRKVRNRRCSCKFESFCDSRSSNPSDDPINDANLIRTHPLEDSSSSPNVESSYVQGFYDTIAEHFSSTRYKGWPKVLSFLSQFSASDVIADVGCGNGKYLRHANGARVIGFDLSMHLLQICARQGFQVVNADALAIPLKNESVDGAISIAVLHHLSSRDRRLQAIRELLRIVKPSGEILIYAWAYEQDENSKRKFCKQDVYVPWELKESSDVDVLTVESKSALSNNSNRLASGIPLFEKDMTRWRYCHLYRKGELEILLDQVPNCSILESYFDTSNWCIRIKREY